MRPVTSSHASSTYQIKNAPGLIETEVFGLTPKYDEYVENSSLLIGHCGRISSPGAGTILDCIKTGTPAIIVSNEGMMHNHQLELLDALIEENAIIGFKESGVVNPTSMDEAITKIEKKVVKPLNIPKDNNIFKHILDEGRYD